MREELILSPTEEDLYRSRYHGLLPGQIEYPLGPIHPLLPFPIYLNLTLEQRKIIKVQSEIGWSHQGIEKILESINAQEGCEIIQRINPLCPRLLEHFFRLANQLDPIDEAILKSEIKSYHIYFIKEILKLLNKNHLIKLLEKDFEKFKKRFLESKKIKHRLSGLGCITLEEALSHGLTGPSLQACYPPYQGDAWSRLCIKLDMISNPNILKAPEGDLIITRLPGRIRIKTPAFAHAGALNIFLKDSELNDLTLILLSLGLVGTEIDR